MNAELIVIKLNTVSRNTNEWIEPELIESETNFKSIIQEKFNTVLKGIPGNVLVLFNGKLFLCERNNLNPDGPYVRQEIMWHPLAEKFTSQSKDSAVVSPDPRQ
jgi:hypothetical protein